MESWAISRTSGHPARSAGPEGFSSKLGHKIQQEVRLIRQMFPLPRPSYMTFDFVFRRTADVRTVGYMECFVLSKEDVLSAVRDYPEAQV